MWLLPQYFVLQLGRNAANPVAPPLITFWHILAVLVLAVVNLQDRQALFYIFSWDNCWPYAYMGVFQADSMNDSLNDSTDYCALPETQLQHICTCMLHVAGMTIFLTQDS